jgi:hypothetical protein
MTKFIETARRVGSLDIVPNLLEKAEKFSPRTIVDPGYHYCKGLYEWYTGIIFFNNFKVIYNSRELSDLIIFILLKVIITRQ